MDTPAQIVPFESEEFGELRTLTIAGEPMFVVSDLCKALGISNPSMVAARLDGDDLSTTEVIDSIGRNQKVNVTNESGMYEIVFMSRKPEAKRFRRWVTHEVLPAIRRDGAYVASTGAESEADLMARALVAAKRRIDEREAEIARLRPRAMLADATDPAGRRYTVTEAVRYIAQAVPGARRDRAFGILRRSGMMVRRGTAPTRAGIDTGRLAAVEQEFTTPGGETVAHQRGVLTPKGLAWLMAEMAGEVA